MRESYFTEINNIGHVRARQHAAEAEIAALGEPLALIYAPIALRDTPMLIVEILKLRHDYDSALHLIRDLSAAQDGDDFD